MNRAAWTSKYAPQARVIHRAPSAPDRMNKTERAFHDQCLKLVVAAGDALSIGFQRLKLRLADKTWYTPDFDLVRESGIEIYEVKGHWEDDARVKIKVAAELYPHFAFFGVRKTSHSWAIEAIGSKAKTREAK